MKWCSGWQKRHHIGWFLPLAFFKPISAPPPSEGRPEGPPHPSQCLRGLNPDPSQRGHSSPSCRKHSTNSRDSSCAERAKLLSAIRTSFPGGRASGCWRTAGATSFVTLIFYHKMTSKGWFFTKIEL